MPCGEKKPLKIGLTGPPAAGKSTILKAFEDLGFPVFSADEVVRRLSRPCKEGYHRLVKAFGEEILSASGELNRHLILRKMLEDSGFKRKLEDLLHPLVKKELLSWLESEGDAPLKVAEIPLLFQAGWEGIFDMIIFVSCPREILLKRLKDRLGDEHLAQALLRTYEKELPEIKKAFVLSGTLPENQLRQKISEIISKAGL